MEVIIKLRDLETKSKDKNKGYISSELLDLNDLDIEEIEAIDIVNKEVVQGRVTRSSSRIV